MDRQTIIDLYNAAAKKSANTLYQRVKKLRGFEGIRLSDVKEVIDEIEDKRFKRTVETKKNRTLYPIIADRPRLKFQADVMYMKPDRVFKYILCIIDVFSRFAWAFPITKLSSKVVERILERMFAKGHKPKYFNRIIRRSL